MTEGSWELLESGYRFIGLGSLEVREIAPSDHPAFREALSSANTALSEGVVLVRQDPG